MQAPGDSDEAGPHTLVERPGLAVAPFIHIRIPKNVEEVALRHQSPDITRA